MHIGVVQMHLSPDLNKNTLKILDIVMLAARRKIDILCFPECAITGYIVNHHKTRMVDIRKEISKIQGASDKSGVSLIVGTSWPCSNYKNKRNVYNAAAIIRPQSRIKLYFKNNLTEFDKKYFSRGNSIVTFKVKDIRCGVLICRDQNDPLLASKYGNIDILFYLASHYYGRTEAIKKMRKNKSFPIVRAIENKIFVAKADSVGRQGGLVNLGGSIIVNPKGEVIAEGKKGKQEMLEFYL